MPCFGTLKGEQENVVSTTIKVLTNSFRSKGDRSGTKEKKEQTNSRHIVAQRYYESRLFRRGFVVLNTD